MKISVKKTLDYYLGGFAIALLFFPVRLLGVVLKRNHTTENPKNIFFIKMLGGGSLLLALPMILSIKRKYPKCRISLICARPIAHFANSYQCFDSVEIIEDKNMFSLARTTLGLLFRNWGNFENVVDLEVHSRLTTLLATLTRAKNRIGFVDSHSIWRKRLYTHAVYYNVFNSVYLCFDAIAKIFHCEEISVPAFLKHVKGLFRREDIENNINELKGSYFVFGAGCSNLSIERRLPTQYWQELLCKLEQSFPETQMVFLGSREEIGLVDEISINGKNTLNLCGRISINDSLRVMAGAKAFVGIDSILLHFARVLCPKVVSFWGPTKPESLLRPASIQEKVFYSNLPCSPCVHVTEHPSCHGNNICMQNPVSNEVIDFLDSVSQNIKGHEQSQGSRPIWVSYPYEPVVRSHRV